MSTLVCGQYGQLQGKLTRSGLVLTVDAQTPRRDSVHATVALDSSEQIVYLLAIVRAAECRINQFQVKDIGILQAGSQEDLDSATNSVSREPDAFEPNLDSRHRVYGRFPPSLIYERAEQSKLRVFFAARDGQNRVARFDLYAGELQAFQVLAERALFRVPQVDLLLWDELSLSVAMSASKKGMVFDVQTPVSQSHFSIAGAHNLANLGVFLRRVINGGKAAPLRFDTGPAGIVFHRKPDGRVVLEFCNQDSSRRVTLPRLHLYELEVVTRYALYQSFETENVETQAPLGENAMTSATH